MLPAKLEIIVFDINGVLYGEFPAARCHFFMFIWTERALSGGRVSIKSGFKVDFLLTGTVVRLSGVKNFRININIKYNNNYIKH